jgi:hypothetical protein
MIVAVGPPIEAVEEHLDLLCRLTGLVAYDLKTRLRPDSWGVVRALADPEDAQELARGLRQNGLKAVVLDPAIVWEPARRTVSVRSIEMGSETLLVNLREGTLRLPYRSLVTIVRGEPKIGETTLRPGGARASGSYLVPAAASGDVSGGHELSTGGGLDAVAVADLHFVDPLCVARLDIKTFDFSSVGFEDRNIEILDGLVNRLAESAGVHVDRASRRSSLLSQVPIAPPARVTPLPLGGSIEGCRATATPRPADSSVKTPRRPPADPRFDGYSRLVGEAERLSLAPTVA